MEAGARDSKFDVRASIYGLQERLNASGLKGRQILFETDH